MATMYCGVRTNTFRCPTSSATVWTTWMPVAPMPTTPTRLPARSSGSFGQRPVWTILPLKLSCPGKTSVSGADSIPQQVTRNRVSIVSPVPVSTVQRFVASSKRAAVIGVLNWMSLRRSRRSAT
jgi:hypothetical protein